LRIFRFHLREPFGVTRRHAKSWIAILMMTDLLARQASIPSLLVATLRIT